MSRRESSLSVYWGGLLLNACMPLEIDLNVCSHGCKYCFSILNDPDRRANVKQIYNLLANFRNSKTYAAHLLREGYPIVIANSIDPFASSNDKISIPLIETLTDLSIPFSLQTKGGKRLEEALDIIDRPIVFYMSIATLDEDIAKSIEPGAPPIAERLRQMELIISRGHKICAGINPVVPQWLPNPKALTDRLADIGVWGAWIQSIHLSNRQLGNMPERDRTAMGEDVIAQALKPSKYSIIADAIRATKEAAIGSGLHVYDSQQAEPTRYFEPYRECYPKSFPLMQDFVNHCHENFKEGDRIYFSDFLQFFRAKLPAGTWPLRNHLNATTVPQVLYGAYISQRMDYAELLKQLWIYNKVPLSPTNVLCFSRAAAEQVGENSFIEWADNDNLPILLFHPQGTKNAYTLCNV